MTPLGERIADLIGAAGPLSVADFMALCLSDPKHGYYMREADPFGSRGDFTTAPEVSQMFGELIGAWLVAAWRASDRPAAAAVVEIGPGRGTLMKDLTRTLGQVEPGLLAAADIVLVETSPARAATQRATLGTAAPRLRWATDLDALPAAPLFLVANELFDALPVRQYVKVAGAWCERAVGLDEAGELAFVAAAGTVDHALLPADAATAPDGAVVELAPARSALMARIASRLAEHGGAALVVDYGYERPAVGDTLQALRRHAPEHPLANPGEADLTSHVDFDALAKVARQSGLAAHIRPQGDFLLAMGLLERAGRLGAAAGPDARDALQAAVERLAGPDQMGKLFKVLAVAPAGVRLPVFGQAG